MPCRCQARLSGFLCVLCISICIRFCQSSFCRVLGLATNDARQLSALPTIHSARIGPSEYTNKEVDSKFSESLIEALDLEPLFRDMASHAGTKRGYQAILAMINRNEESGVDYASSSRRMTALRSTTPSNKSHKSQNTPIFAIAASAEEALLQYELVEAASLALSTNDKGTDIALTVNNFMNLTYPPIYGSDSNPSDTGTIPTTDHDEWLDLPPDAWTVENIIQAEQVIKSLIQTKEWASCDATKTWTPQLSQLAMQIDPQNILPAILEDIAGAVEIVQFKTLKSSSSKPGYSFRLKTHRYPILRLLREKEQILIQSGAKQLDRQLQEIQDEMQQVETEICKGLAQLVLGNAKETITTGIDVMAWLDVIFARAAYGIRIKGQFPRILKEATMDVADFVHPVLLLRDGHEQWNGNPTSTHQDRKYPDAAITPVDLKLSSVNISRTLLISGPNGGGKTLAMKSFGVASILAKIGVPIPTRNPGSKPRVGFARHIFTNVGDQQNIHQGESTWTSNLNAYARIINLMESKIQNNNDVCLILLDELGSGTDPEAGGAIGQAILEELQTFPNCQIVATTHSPRLKVLSFENERFSCASVLLKDGPGYNEWKIPSFRLEYGTIGESYAFGAASRCYPPLPKSLIDRASKILLSDSYSKSNYFQALTKSLELQSQEHLREKLTTLKLNEEIHLCRNAMIGLASSYNIHLDRLQLRLEDVYARILDDTADQLKIVGNSLEALKVVKKQVEHELSFLQSKGLKLLPESYKLNVGDHVVLIGDFNAWEDVSVEVVADASVDKSLKPNEVLVQHSLSPFGWGVMQEARSRDCTAWIVQRHHLAIWDYESIWDENGAGDRVTGKETSKNRVQAVLSSLKSKGSTMQTSPKMNKTFSSSRARKAARKSKR